MNFFVVFIAILGLLFGALPGAIVGALIGYVLSLAFVSALQSGVRNTQSYFVDVTFSVMGALSKADGVVSREEIQAAERVFDMLRLTGA